MATFVRDSEKNINTYVLQTSDAPKDRISGHIPQKQKLSDVSQSAAAVGRFMKADSLENIPA